MLPEYPHKTKIINSKENIVFPVHPRTLERLKQFHLYKKLTNSKNIFLLSKILLEKFNGEVPADRDALVKLPGVGRKTANVVLNTFFNKPYIAVDTHLFRLGNRIWIARGKTTLEVENNYLKII